MYICKRRDVPSQRRSEACWQIVTWGRMNIPDIHAQLLPGLSLSRLVRSSRLSHGKTGLIPEARGPKPTQRDKGVSLFSDASLSILVYFLATSWTAIALPRYAVAIATLPAFCHHVCHQFSGGIYGRRPSIPASQSHTDARRRLVYAQYDPLRDGFADDLWILMQSQGRDTLFLFVVSSYLFC